MGIEHSFDGEAFFVMRIVECLTIRVEDHGSSRTWLKWAPRGQAAVIRITCPRKSDPSSADFIGERVAVLAVAGHPLDTIHMIEHKRQFHAMHAANFAVPKRRIPLK